MEVVDQVTTLILMEEQVTETVFGCIKLIIWKKLSKFIQVSCSICQCLNEIFNCGHLSPCPACPATSARGS